MLIGVPKEVKTHEYRVGLTPGSVRELVHHGHDVLVETGAGAGVGFIYSTVAASGARVVPSVGDVYAGADLIVKV
jgi:alanine dehydrogenase